MSPVPLQLLLFGLLGLALVVSVVTDLLARRIPDAITLSTLVLALALRGFLEGVGDLEHGLVSGVVGAAAAGGFLAAMAAWGKAFGGGDVKLVGAVGAALGYPLALAALLFISLAGAAQALLALLWQGALWETLRGAARRWGAKVGLVPTGVAGPRRHIPYAIAIAIGSFWAMWWERSKV